MTVGYKPRLRTNLTMVDEVCDLRAVDFTALSLPMLVIYDRPKEYPTYAVVRIWDLETPTDAIFLAPTIEEAEAAIPEWFAKIGPSAGDEPHIVGVFV